MSRVFEKAVAILATAGICFTIAVATGAASHAWVWVAVASGPVGGWVIAVWADALPGALELLLPTSIPCALLLLRFMRTREFALLVASCLAWLAVGYLFAIGLWI